MRRVFILIPLLVLALSACERRDDPRAPFTDSRIPPGLQHRFYPPHGWAWGLIKVGKAPPVRYGVAAPASTPRGQVIILPAEGEIAEAWFETAHSLIDRGFVVWVMEPAGQGGSGRYVLPRSRIHAPNLDPDVAALMVLGATVARNRPQFVLAAGASTPLAARAAALGLKLDGLALVEPRVARAQAYSDLEWRSRLGVGWLGAPHGVERRDGMFGAATVPSGDALTRYLVTARWRQANPDLRVSGASSGWYLALARESDAAERSWSRIAAPVLILGQVPAPLRKLCAKQRNCSLKVEDTDHAAFMRSLLGFIDPDRAGLAPAPAAATVDPES